MTAHSGAKTTQAENFIRSATAPLMSLLDRGLGPRRLIMLGSLALSLTYALMPGAAGIGWPALASLIVLNAVAGAVIAVLLLVWRHWVPAFLVTGFGASTLGAFVVSATVGLFGVNETWTGGWVLTAAASEVVCIVGGLVLLYREWAHRRPADVRPAT